MTSISPISCTTTHSEAITVDRDFVCSRIERARRITATIKTRELNGRRRDAEIRTIWGFYSGSLPFEFAPKWTRHSADEVNPHLRPDERKPMAPKYGPDAIPRRYIAPRESCGCECCRIWMMNRETHARLQAQRQMALALKKAANHTSAVWRNRCLDWDWNGWDDPFAYDGDDDWRLDHQADKPAPLFEIDLMAMAKPAKIRRRRVALPTPSKAQFVNDVSDIDEISLLDSEEAWDDLGVDHISVVSSEDQTSDTSGEWDRCSNI